MALKLTATNNGYTATLTLTPGKQDIAANTTQVAYVLTLTAGSNYFSDWPIGWEIWLAGSQVAYRAIRGAPQKSISAGGTITLVSGNTTITHNADGTMKASIGFRVDGGTDANYLPGTIRYAGKQTLDLPTIPRASGLSLSAGSVTLDGKDGSVKVTVSAHSTSFSHKVKYTFGSASGEISLNAGATTGTLSLPMSLLSQIPTNTSGTATVTLTTYNGKAAIGTATAKLTIIAGASIVPTVSAFTATRVGQSALAMYIKGYNKARLRTTAEGVYGSAIRTYEVTGGLSGADVTTGNLWTAGKASWTVKVTDSRGRTASKSVSVDVVDYYTPKVSGASFERCTANGTPDDDGTFLQVSASISIAPCGGANAKSAKVQYKLQSDEYWTDAGAFSGSSQLYDLGLSDQAYDVRLAVTDKLSTGYASATLDVGDVLAEYDPGEHRLDLLPSVVRVINHLIAGSAEVGGGLSVGGPVCISKQMAGTSGAEGYIRIATIQINAVYVNTPLLFELSGRGRHAGTVEVLFVNRNDTDPELASLVYTGGSYEAAIVRTAAGKWELYAKKNGPYDSIAVHSIRYNIPYIRAGITITLDGETQVYALPDNAVTATKLGG